MPDCTTAPPSTITTASQILSTSSRWWDERMMCMPNSVPMRRMRSSISVALHGVEPVGRLVEEHELGVVRDRRGELHALPLAGRHRPDRAEALLAEPDEPERVVGALHGGAAGEEVDLGQVAHEVGRRELRREVVVLGRVADARPQLEPGRRRVLAEHAKLARVARAEPEDERR